MVAARFEDINLAEFIDHALLIPWATPEQVIQWCEESIRFGFAAVCLFPIHIRQAAEILHNQSPKTCAVIGFPSGASTSATKLFEAQDAVENGATELDVVMNLSWLKTGRSEEAHRELAEICELGCPVKAILETNVLTNAEKQMAAEVAVDAGATFLKTSTGWNGGVSVDDVKLLKELSRDRVGIKAAGGIRTPEQAFELILAGATRLGTSRGAEMLRLRDRPQSDSTEPTE